MNLFLQELVDRGLVFDCTDITALSEEMDKKPITLYCGFDPTADSLHVGHLIPMISLMRFKLARHNPIALVGGATGLIGDPSGKNKERDTLLESLVESNVQSIEAQIANITKLNVKNNIDWTKSMSVIEFMRKLGKHFTINNMLSRDSVTNRIESGLSFTEFSYMLFQGNDFLELAKTDNCVLQIGGSDQYGNMCSGLDLLRKNDLTGFALTFPLLVKSDGTKFGKSEGGTVWLDSTKTSEWDFFQFWMATTDEDVIKYLKLFTFLSLEEIASLELSIKTEPEKRLAQTTLATEMTKLIHGDNIIKDIIEVQSILFKNTVNNVTDNVIKILKGIIPVSNGAIYDQSDLKNALANTGLAGSKTQAGQLIKQNAISFVSLKNGSALKITEYNDTFDLKYPFLIKAGKKKFGLITNE